MIGTHERGSLAQKVAAAVSWVVFRRRRMIQQAYAVQRAEERIDMRVTALLVGKQDKLGVETGETTDISSRGARVVARSERPIGDTLLVAIPGFQFTAA